MLRLRLRVQVFNGREIELDRLHAVVQRRGGYEAVTEDRAWREIANVLDVSEEGRCCGVEAAQAAAATIAAVVALPSAGTVLCWMCRAG